MKNQSLKGTVLVILSAIAFGLMPMLSKLSMREGLNVSSILGLRFAMASLLIWGYIFTKKIPYRTTKKHLLYLLVLSVIGYVGTSASYFTALKYISSYIAAIILYLHPALIVIYEIAVLKYEKDIRKFIALLISTIGIVLIVWSDTININTMGIALSLGAACFYTFYILGLQEKRTKAMHSIVVIGYVMVFAAASFLLQGVMTHSLHLPQTMKGFYYILIFALIPSGFAMIAFCTGVKLIGGGRAAIISTLEPAFATFLGVLVFKEELTSFTFIGGCLIIMAIMFLQGNRTIGKRITRKLKSKT